MIWDGEDRRKRAGSETITVDDLEEALEIHAAKEREHLREVIAELRSAFPNEDFRRHHDYHEQKNKAAQAEEEFWKTAKTTLIQAGVTGVIKLVWIICVLVMLGLTVKVAAPEAVTKFLMGTLLK